MTSDCITPRARAWLQRARSPRWLHCLDRVYNLVDADAGVLSLTDPTVPLGPFAWRVAALPPAVDGVQTPLALVDGRLRVGERVVSAESTPLWQPRPDWSRLRARPLPPADAVAPPFAEPLRAVTAACRRGDAAAAGAAAARLAGLGPGLTPAGDDMLTGVLFALWVWYPSRPIMTAVIAHAVPRTTTLSAAFLHAAADGEAAEPWHDLVAGHPDAVRRLLAVGHTSGRDAWAGFVTARAALTG